MAEAQAMTVQYYPNGIGGTAPGDSLDLARPLMTTGNVWYVSSLIGTDAASPAGQNREKPLGTLAQAVTNAVDGDIIVFLPGHAQTLTAVQQLNKRLTLIGEGTANGKPSVSFTMNAAALTMLNPTVDGVELRNIHFPPSAQANTGVKVGPNGGVSDLLVRGCYFEQGATDLAAGLSVPASRYRVEDSTFISVATLTSAQPLMAIQGFGTVTGFTMRNCVVSAGTAGFSRYSAVDFTAATLTNMDLEGISLLLGADIAFPSTATGRVNIQLATGGSRVIWS
jgi:hypothetical protein